MRFTKRAPCANCPFRRDVRFFLTKERAEEITNCLKNDGHFACHKTVDYSGDGDGLITEDSVFCAGALIMLEKEGIRQNNAFIRIAMAVGLFNPKRLKMNSPVYNSCHEFISAME